MRENASALRRGHGKRSQNRAGVPARSAGRACPRAARGRLVVRDVFERHPLFQRRCRRLASSVCGRNRMGRHRVRIASVCSRGRRSLARAPWPRSDVRCLHRVRCGGGARRHAVRDAPVRPGRVSALPSARARCSVRGGAHASCERLGIAILAARTRKPAAQQRRERRSCGHAALRSRTAVALSCRSCARYGVARRLPRPTDDRAKDDAPSGRRQTRRYRRSD